MKIFVGILFALTLTSAVMAQKTSVQDIDQRVESLLGKMTLDEKIGQLNMLPGGNNTGTAVERANLMAQVKAGNVGAILTHSNFDEKIALQRAAVKETRLGIPLVFGFDVIHGYKTIFPIPLAQAASWDMVLIENIERIAATEAAADGQNWTFSPMVDIARDPRWGRVMEGAGEDPFLGSRVAEARIRGFQGDDLSNPLSIAACAKHFAGYGFIEGGREYNAVDMSERRLREFVLPPFEAAARAGAATFMHAFNTLNGVPAGMHKHLISNILKGEWAWKGMLVSDWNSIGETIIHGLATDDVDASAKCLLAGTDMDMAGGTYLRGLKQALQAGRITEAQINEAVRRVLRLKMTLGLFDDPFRYLDPKRRAEFIEKPEYRLLAREAAAKSMVLLKNDGGLLPLTPNSPFKKILLIGPYADSRSHKDYMSSWTQSIGISFYDSTKVVTPAMAIKPSLEKMGFEVTVKEICLDPYCNEKDLSTALKASNEAEIVVVCVGEQGNDCGESRSVANLNLKIAQEQLLKIVSRGSKPTVMVLFNSRPMTFEWATENIPAILVAWQPGFETGNALADVLTGKVNPSGKLPITFPRHVGQIPLYYNHENTGRPGPDNYQIWTSGYLDQRNSPAYPFGWGLSYSRYVYSDIKLSQNQIRLNETIEVSVTVSNTGGMAGEEVVQLYIHDEAADVAPPVKALKGFQKIKLEAGENKTVSFKIGAAELAYWNQDNVRKADPGKFTVMVGPNSVELKRASFDVLK